MPFTAEEYRQYFEDCCRATDSSIRDMRACGESLVYITDDGVFMATRDHGVERVKPGTGTIKVVMPTTIVIDGPQTFEFSNKWPTFEIAEFPGGPPIKHLDSPEPDGNRHARRKHHAETRRLTKGPRL